MAIAATPPTQPLNHTLDLNNQTNRPRSTTSARANTVNDTDQQPDNKEHKPNAAATYWGSWTTTKHH